LANQRKTARKIKGFGRDTILSKTQNISAASTKERSLVPDVIALRPFVPAKDFETSLRFFADLGFRAYRLGDLLASMHIGPFAFLLQGRPNDDERFAANFMMHMFVEDIDAWWPRIADLDLSKRYGVKAPSAPALQPWGLVVAYVWDPSGVLWRIAKDPTNAGR
jgi:Glyoxalase/Bleomycin resistance protein/Dioxygenase superfamily